MRQVSTVAGLALAVLATASAQQPLSVAAAVAQALGSHPLLSAGSERIAVTSGLLAQAGLRPNPRATLQTENWRPYERNWFEPSTDTDTFAMLTQPFELGAKRARRQETAAAAVRRAELERHLLSRQIAARVRMAYWNAAGAEKVRQLWVENGRTFQQVVEYHEIRVREGAMAEADLLKVRLEGERLALAANAAALDFDRARIQLFRAMGGTEFPAVRLTDVLDLSPAPKGDVARAVADRVEVQLARHAVEQARANLRLQQSLARPDLDATLGYKRTAGYNTAMAGLSMAIPFRNRNQGSIAAAGAEIRAAEAEVAAAVALVKAEVASADREVEMRRAQISGLLKNSLTLAAESSRIALAAYREGGADLLRLLDAERVRIELEVLYYRSLTEYRQSVVTWETAMGVTE
jgi:outer membrane protein, heavy metal efflux system